MKNANELTTSRQLAKRYCFTCGRLIERHRYKCDVCGEMTCSRKCAQRHLEAMDRRLNAAFRDDAGV